MWEADYEGVFDVLDKDEFPKQTSGVKKKIYPNDPCPYNSGKKYKKHCRKRQSYK